ncbi:MAG: hypothetical protein O3A00_21525 [Planctomycetota bacterium]|nr:hypothetical protein [Planctomycetota bacterium]
MHIFGKVLLWMVMLAWLPALVLASKMLHIQNSWSKSLDTVKKAGEGLEETAIGKERELFEAQDEFARTMLGWGQSFSPVTIMQFSPTGQLRLGIGTNHGVRSDASVAGQPPDTMPVLYGFQLDPNTGASKFIGEFEVIAGQLRENDCDVRPTWRPFDQEIQGWNATVPWRFRSAVPGGYKLRFDDFKNRFTNIRVDIDTAQRNLAKEQTQFDDANALLQFRMTQLNGRVGVPVAGGPTDVDPEFPTGVLPTIDAIEEERNDAEFELDRLRRLIKTAKDEVESLKKDVKQLYQQLPM